jgi:hypothetical protein
MKAKFLALAVVIVVTVPSLAYPCVIRPGSDDVCETPPKHFVIADVGLHVVNVGWATTVDREKHGVFQLSAGVYGPWTQTGNVFGVSGDAVNINVIGANMRLRLVWYPGKHQHGLWVSPFAQAGAGRIHDEKAVRDVSHVGFVGSVGAAAGYAWGLGDAWHLAVGAGGQFHVATGSPGFARPYPHIDAIVSYRL